MGKFIGAAALLLFALIAESFGHFDMSKTFLFDKTQP
jgi:hypothetical protein